MVDGQARFVLSRHVQICGIARTKGKIDAGVAMPRARRRNSRSTSSLAPQNPPGVLGDGELLAGKYNMALVRRAIRNGWNVPAVYKSAVVEQMGKIVTKSKKLRDKIAAAKVLVTADSNDLRAELGAKDAGRPIAPAATPVPVNVNVGVNVQAVPAIDISRLTDEQLASLEDIARAAAVVAPAAAGESAVAAGDPGRALPT
jgi:hypothetical protein